MVRFLLKLAVLLLAIVIQFKFLSYFGWTLDLTLAALVAIAFFASWPEEIVFLSVGAWFLGYEPGIGWTTLIYLALPLIVFVGRRALPWQPWINNLMALAAALILFYLVAVGAAALVADFGRFLWDIGGSLVFGAAAFWLFHDYLKYRNI
ncbi:MAG: hypothetical protein AAB686_00085 [Patescibacteria group bacterium]